MCLISLFSLLLLVFCLFFLGEFLGWLGGLLLVFMVFCFIFLCFISLFCMYFFFDFHIVDSICFFFFDFNISLFFFSCDNNFSINYTSSSIIILFTLFMVSFFVHLFSFHYMSFDQGRLFFICVLSFFTLSMSLLISSSNFIFMLIFFELISWSSYILISWFMTIDSFKSGTKAVILSRFSDFVFFSIIFEFFSYISTFCSYFFDFISLYSFFFTVVCFIFLLSKSAIFPFHSWLIWAMSGPTPVSSLLHSATLVTTSYVILSNFFTFYVNCFFFSYFLIYVLFNVVFGSLFSIFSYDVKKLIAYSTMSQISLIIVFFFVSPDLSFLYFSSHGFVKSSIFMCVGFVFHFFIGQDIRSSYGSFFFIRFYYLGLFLCSLFLSSFPLSILFYIKDFIIDSSFVFFDSYSLIYSIILNYSIFLTAIYSYFILNVFFDIPYRFVNINYVLSSRSYTYYCCYYLLFLYMFFFVSFITDIPFFSSVLVCLIFSNIISVYSSYFLKSSNFYFVSSNISFISFISYGLNWDFFLNFLSFIFIRFFKLFFILFEYFLFEHIFFFNSSFFLHNSSLYKSNFLYYIIFTFIIYTILIISYFF